MTFSHYSNTAPHVSQICEILTFSMGGKVEIGFKFKTFYSYTMINYHLF